MSDNTDPCRRLAQLQINNKTQAIPLRRCTVRIPSLACDKVPCMKQSNWSLAILPKGNSRPRLLPLRSLPFGGAARMTASPPRINDSPASSMPCHSILAKLHHGIHCDPIFCAAVLAEVVRGHVGCVVKHCSAGKLRVVKLALVGAEEMRRAKSLSISEKHELDPDLAYRPASRIMLETIFREASTSQHALVFVGVALLESARSRPPVPHAAKERAGNARGTQTTKLSHPAKDASSHSARWSVQLPPLDFCPHAELGIRTLAKKDAFGDSSLKPSLHSLGSGAGPWRRGTSRKFGQDQLNTLYLRFEVIQGTD